MAKSKDEVHEKSPVESVEEFFAWMHKKARNDGGVVRGQVDGIIYEISEDLESLFKAIEKSRAQ